MLPQAWSLGMIGWYGIFPSIIASLALVGIAAVVFYALRQSANKQRKLDGADPSSPSTEADLSPREILQIRYVCGEITRDQYYEMLSDLN